MNLRARLCTGLDEVGHEAGLRAGIVVLAIAARGEEEGVVAIGRLGCGAMANRNEARPAVGMMKPIAKQPRSSRMGFRRTRPEHTLLALDAFVGNAAVVSPGPGRGPAKFGEDLAWRREFESWAFSQALGQSTQDLDITAHARRGRACRVS